MNQIYNILKAKFLVDDNSLKNWIFIIFLMLLAMLMISNNHWYEQKIFTISKLENEIKVLKATYVETKSEVMQRRMESTITKQMIENGIKPATAPPIKIKVTKPKEKNLIEKIWQP